MPTNTAPNYGKGEYSLPEDTIDLAENQAQLRAWLDGFLQQPKLDLPRPPAVALEVLALSRKPNARIEDIASVLEREPLLAGRVLRLANSALYGGQVPCVTLKSALIRMGLSIVRDVVMEAAMQMTVIHADGLNETLESIRRHSSAVAWISRFVARNTPLEAENAFLTGLLHDVGMSVALVGLAQWLRQQKKPVALTSSRWVCVESVHEKFSEAVLNSWGMPPQVTLVMQHHHTLNMGGHPHPQVAVLLIAEQIAADAGWDVTPKIEHDEHEVALSSVTETSVMDHTDVALQALNLTRKHFDMVTGDMKRVLETLSGQFPAKKK